MKKQRKIMEQRVFDIPYNETKRAIELEENFLDVLRYWVTDHEVGRDSKALYDKVREIIKRDKALSLEAQKFWREEALRRYWKIEKTKTKETIYMFPYEITEGNNLLWYVGYNISDDYNSGMKDGSVSLGSYTGAGASYTITEISEDEFRETAILGITAPIEQRLRKLKEREKL